jgi:hypothetical protein
VSPGSTHLHSRPTLPRASYPVYEGWGEQMSRQVTNRLVELLDEGVLSYEQICLMCLQTMSEDDVSDMVNANDLSDLVDGGMYESE